MFDPSIEEASNTQINRPAADSSNGEWAKDPRLPQAEAYCRKIARGHYENFIVASVLLPRRMRQPFYNVYAFCRFADDLADESESPQAATRSLNWWQGELDRCFLGQADHPIFIALGQTVRELDLPKRPFDDLLDAFRQDQVKTRYADFPELIDYCRRSADPVGRLVLRMAGCDSPENVTLSDRICTGLQLANHWQDIARDYAAGRIYLPEDAMREAGVTESMLGEALACEPLKRLIAEQSAIARRMLESGLPLAERVPKWLAADIRLFVRGGEAILDAIAAADHDTLVRRPKVSPWRQMLFTAQAIFGRL